MSFVRAVATVGGLTMLSRVAGFVRDILTAGILGAGPVADAFFVALRLPNFFRRLSAEGSFTVAFVPLFSAELQRDGHPAAIRFAREALSAMLGVLLPFTAVMILVMPWVITVLAPGFVDDVSTFNTAVDLARITFPYLVLISAVALLGGVLNALDRFAPFAAVPVFFNVTLIGALVLAQVAAWPAADALAWGVTLAGVVQLAFMVWCVRRTGTSIVPAWPRWTPRIGRLLTLMAPGAVGAGVHQISTFIDTVLASIVATGAVSYLYFADRLYQLPLGVIGIAIGTALLPVLSRAVEAGDGRRIEDYFSRALEFGLLLALPAAVALAIAAEPVIRVLFERGAWDATATAATASALTAYAIGIPAYVMVKVLSTAYFARQDTAGPVKVAVVATVVNAGLGVALIQVMGHVGIALATGLSAWLNVALLAFGLHRRRRLTLDSRLRRRAPRLLIASALMGGVVAGSGMVLAPWLTGPESVRAVALVALVVIGLVSYFAAAQLLGATNLADLRALLRRPAWPMP